MTAHVLIPGLPEGLAFTTMFAALPAALVPAPFSLLLLGALTTQIGTLQIAPVAVAVLRAGRTSAVSGSRRAAGVWLAVAGAWLIGGPSTADDSRCGRRSCDRPGPCHRPTRRRPAAGRSLHSARWICTSSGRWRRRPSGRPSMRCSGRPSRAGSAGRATHGSMAMRHPVATRRAPGARSCCRRSTRSSRGSAGSASRPSTTSAGGWRSPRPRRTAWRRSTRSSPPRRDHRSWSTSATTSPAAWPARNGSATTWRAAWRRPASRSTTAARPGSAARVSGCATGHPRRWSPGRARRRARRSSHRSTRSG